MSKPLLINPIEEAVFQGVQRRVSEVFGCPAVITTNYDKVQVLQRLRAQVPDYPYIFLIPNVLGANPSSYVTSRLARTGLAVTLEDVTGTGYNVRLLPANFDFQLEFVTNKFMGADSDSVMAFSRRWLFARRLGYLKFNMNYGQLNVPVGITMDESVSLPSMDNKAEAEAVYTLIANFTLHGYVSEPELREMAVISEVQVTTVLRDANGEPSATYFVPFNEEQ